MSDMDKNVLEKNVLSSTHINFLFGAGVNGDALPQLKSFSETISEVERFGGDTANGLENGIDDIESDEEREHIKGTFINEFKKYHEVAIKPETFKTNESIRNLKSLIKMTYLIVNEAQNRIEIADPLFMRVRDFLLIQKPLCFG